MSVQLLLITLNRLVNPLINYGGMLRVTADMKPLRQKILTLQRRFHRATAIGVSP
jgi:hypothetical protein